MDGTIADAAAAAAAAATVATAAAAAAADAAALATGVASNAFGVLDNEGVEPLSLPLEGNYPSFEAARDAANQHAMLAGYAMTTGAHTYKDPRKGHRARKWVVCKHNDSRESHAKGGVCLKDSERKQKKVQSKKTGCPVKMKVMERRDGSWDLKRLENPKHTTHNHLPNDRAAYHEHRKLDDEQLAIIKANTLTGIPPSRTLTALKTADPTGVWTTRDIRNAAARFKSESLQGQRPNEALIAKLELARDAQELFFEYTLSDEGRIEKLFIADMRCETND